MNEKKIYTSLLTSSAEDALLLDAWLDERVAFLEAKSWVLPSEIAESVQDNMRLARACGEFDSDIKPGQIRILSKRFTDDPDVIPYVAVLEEWETGIWLIAPFSMYSYPATAGEMTTGLRHCGLRVVQAWNSRTMHAPLLAKSFLFGSLDMQIVADARALFRNQLAGTELPAEFSALRGSDIIMEADPRCDYISESIARLQPLSESVKRMERARQGTFDLVFNGRIECKPVVIDEAWAHAAGDENGPSVHRLECAVDGRSEIARIVFAAESKRLSLRIFDKDGNATKSLDGWILAGGNGVVLGEIENGEMTADGVDLASVALCLADGNGAVHPIIPSEK